MFLTESEVVELTGCKTAKAQAEWLRRNNIKHYENASRVIVARQVAGCASARPYKTYDLRPSISDIATGKAGKFFSRSEHGVYLLWRGDTVVYVGRTMNLFSRTTGHQMDKEFDRIQFVKMPRDRQDIYEMELIKNLRPKYNVHGIDFVPQTGADPDPESG